MSKIKVFGTVVLYVSVPLLCILHYHSNNHSENVPQLICQALYAYTSGEISDAVGIAFATSLLSVAASTMSYLIEKDDVDVHVTQYYISLNRKLQKTRVEISRSDDSGHEYNIPTNTNVAGWNRVGDASPITSMSSSSPRGQFLQIPETAGGHESVASVSSLEDPDKMMTSSMKRCILENKGRRRALSRTLAAIFEIQAKNIQIGSTMITMRGARTHIVHYMSESAIDGMQRKMNMAVTPERVTSQLFDFKKAEIEHAFTAHFHLEEPFEAVYSDYHDSIMDNMVMAAKMATDTVKEGRKEKVIQTAVVDESMNDDDSDSDALNPYNENQSDLVEIIESLQPQMSSHSDSGKKDDDGLVSEDAPILEMTDFGAKTVTFTGSFGGSILDHLEGILEEESESDDENE